nr:unnamed protein product [Callosobruchus analis]
MLVAPAAAISSAENLCSFLKGVIHEWELGNKITAVVSDNAANVTAAVRLGGWRYVPCFAHTINLIVQSSLRENRSIKSIMDKIKSIDEFFKRSSTALAKLRSAQEGMSLPHLKLKQDVPTRWNSTYDRLSRILQIKDAVIATLAVVKSELNNISPQECNVMQQVTETLEIFYAVTSEISSEKVTTISKVIILTDIMKKHIHKSSFCT